MSLFSLPAATATRVAHRVNAALMTLLSTSLLLSSMAIAQVESSPRNSQNDAVQLRGALRQGAIVRGHAPGAQAASFDGQPLMLTANGDFVFAFGRDDTQTHILTVSLADGSNWNRELKATSREYDIERVDGVPQNTVTPPASVTKRIRREAAQVAQARKRRDQRNDWLSDFIWPAQGRLSGFYGSQRVLNGVPKRPHFGVDVAAPTGTAVIAPAAGIVTLAEDDLFYSGGTIIIDHGHGLSSTFLHMSAVDVEAGQRIEQGERIGAIGATGRASGPHLDWRMNWLNQRVDPQTIAPPMPAQTTQ